MPRRVAFVTLTSHFEEPGVDIQLALVQCTGQRGEENSLTDSIRKEIVSSSGSEGEMTQLKLIKEDHRLGESIAHGSRAEGQDHKSC